MVVSTRRRLTVGQARGVSVTVVAVSVLVGAAVSVGDAVASGSPLAGILGGLVALFLLAGFIALVAIDRTRWIGLGMLAGFAGLFILGAGACVALIVAYNNSV